MAENTESKVDGLESLPSHLTIHPPPPPPPPLTTTPLLTVSLILLLYTENTTHYENTTTIEDLDPDTLRDLRRQLKRNYKEIIFRYASFGDSLCEAVTATGITLKRFRHFLLGLSPYVDDYGDEQPRLLDHVKAEIKEADSISGIFEVLTTECCSFIDVDIFHLIMKKYKIDINSDEDLQYSEHLKSYLMNHKISEFIMINPKLDRFENSDKLVLKFNTDLSSSITKVLDLKSAIADILRLKSSGALQLLSIKEGCVVVTFSILSTVAEKMFTRRGLTSKQEADIRALSVLWLECGDYKLEEIPHNADSTGMIQYHSGVVHIHYHFLSTAVAPELLVPQSTHGNVTDVEHSLDSGMKLPDITCSAIAAQIKGGAYSRPRMIARESHLCSCSQQKHATSFQPPFLES